LLPIGPSSDNTEPTGESVNRRRHGRVRQDELRCNLGHVIDVSRGGLRLLTHRRLRGTRRLVLATPSRPAVRFKARVAWRRRLGFGEFAVGLQFVEVNAEQLRWLSDAAHYDNHPYAAVASSAHRAVRGDHARSILPIGLALLALGAVCSQFQPPAAIQAWPLVNHPMTPAIVTAALLGLGGLVVLGSLRRLAGTSRAASRRPRRAAPNVLDELYSLGHLLRCVLDTSASGVMVLAAVRDERGELADFEVQMASPAVEQLLGRREADLAGRLISAHESDLFDRALYDKLAAALRDGEPCREDRRAPDGQRWLQFAAVRLRDSLAVNITDVTEQKQHAARIEHEANHDPLTGLHNRKAFTNRLMRVVAQDDGSRTAFAVLFIDFDGFKTINDTLGHEAGDLLLVHIADRLRALLDEHGTQRAAPPRCTAARLGGDEFVVLMERAADDDAEQFAQRLVAEFAGPCLIAGKQVTATASVGVVTGGPGHANMQDVLRDADAAMYRAKSAGKSCYRVFDRHMHEQSARQLHLERDLRQAIHEEAFELQYQPVIDLESSRVLGLEALLRWPHPQRGFVPPGRFIALAEQLNLIQPLGAWTLRRACADLAAWRAAHPRHDLFVTVNLSHRQLLDPGLAGLVRQCLREHRLPPRCLWLEVAESAITRDLDAVTAVLHELRDTGVRLALDDFGAGHTVLHGLHLLPFDAIKIDQKLVRGQWHDKRRYAGILHAILELAHNLQLTVVAEGVESADQLTLLQGLDCATAQGWLFSQSLTAEEVDRLLATHHAAGLHAGLWSASAA